MNSHRYLLDTNIISALVKHPQGSVFQKLDAVFPATACTSIIVVAEIEFGLQKRVSKSLEQRVRTILSSIDILPFDQPAQRHYGEIRAHLQRSGQPIGSNDLLIAAHARALNLVLVTHNQREFTRVPGLQLEDWLA